MSDERELMDRFEPLAAASFVPATPAGDLRSEVRRRRRRRRVAGAASAATALVLGGMLAARAGGGRPEANDLVRSGPAPASSVPASYGSEPRLVIGVVPPELSSLGCAKQLLERWVVTCSFGLPSTAVPDGINLVWRDPPLDDGLREAWDRRDARAVATALVGPAGDPAFIRIGGRAVLDMGDTSSFGGTGTRWPARVTHTYEVLVGPSVIQVNAEGVSSAQLEQLVGGLDWQPVDLGFSFPEALLPTGARVLAQGQERRWFEPEPLDPTRSADNGGQASGVTYGLGGARTPLEVVVVRAVDAPAYVASWAIQQERLGGLAAEAISPRGRSGTMVGFRFGGAPKGPISTRRVAVAMDDRTVAIVTGPARDRATMLEIAGQVVTGPRLPSTPSTGPTATSPTTDPDPEGTGWYIPQDLPSGWRTTRSVFQVTDGLGQAQLWMRSPTGNDLVVTLTVPSDMGIPPGAVLHPLAGSITPVYALGGKDGFARASLSSDRPGATIEVALLDGGRAEAQTPEATSAGSDELDVLMGSLRAVGADAWRAYIEPTAPPAALVDAATLADLPNAP